MNDDEETTILGAVGILLIILLIASVLFEIGLFVAFSAGADEVDCHWWGCLFTSSDNYTVINKYSECFHNGVQVNCSEADV